MSWKDKVPRAGTEPEEQLWSILKEMGLRFDMNVPMPSFGIYPLEADVLVEGVLPIEAQGSYWHSKARRHRKDLKKRETFEALGYGYLELWDDELEKACQVEAGKEWRPAVKEWIRVSLYDAKIRRNLWQDYQTELRVRIPEPPLVEVPGLGLVSLNRRRE